ncbi:MAG: hypothetical protein KA319_13925 [Ferruginibacter sp.]|nr:hypothetical protein [Ferruginibacter sp.]
MPKSIKVILFYLLATALINTVAIIVGRVYHSNNLPLVHLYTLMEGLFFVFFFKQILGDINPKYFNVVAVFFTIFCIVNAIYLQSIFAYSSHTRYLVSIIVMLCNLNYFAKIAATEEAVYNAPLFYINVGAFLYFSGSFMLFIFSNVMLQKMSDSSLLVFWVIHSTFVLVMHLLFSISFILCKK